MAVTIKEDIHSTIPCLWSGGWDSTFRILQLVLVERSRVQPIYLEDKRRRSTSFELQAIHSITSAVQAAGNGISELLLPLQVYNKSSLKNYRDLKKHFRKIDSAFGLGVQYLWFARFARQYRIDNLEVSFINHGSDSTPEFNALLESQVRGRGHDCRLVESPVESYLELFRNFRFPTIHMTKEEMGIIAKKTGFLDLLVMSWYCFDPAIDGNPCGKCKPCIIASRSGYREIFIAGN